MVPESPLKPTEHGLVPESDGWFILNAREAPRGRAELDCSRFHPPSPGGQMSLL